METSLRTVAFKAGDTIISEGDEGDTAFYIIDGSVEVSIGQGGRARTLGALGAGEIFGEMCLIEPGPRSATVKAKTNVECVATSYEEFIAAIGEDPQRAVEFMKTLVRRLRQMNDLMAKADPRRRGLRAMVRDWTAPAELDPDVVVLSWSMLW
jgi:CRP/FNR family transcriptional regulator, cyclic AMP receptor protein